MKKLCRDCKFSYSRTLEYGTVETLCLQGVNIGDLIDPVSGGIKDISDVTTIWYCNTQRHGSNTIIDKMYNRLINWCGAEGYLYEEK